MYRGSEAVQLLKILLKPTLLILIWMSLLRALLFAAVFYSKLGFHADLGTAFFAGFRFDLLVLGFAWIPVVTLTWLWALWWSPRKLLFLFKIYFVVLVLLLFDLAWLDLFWTAVTSFRLNHEFFLADSKAILDQGWKLLGASRSWISTLGMGFSSLALVLMIHSVKWKSTYTATPKALLILKMFLSFFLVASAARGTWTAHHLNIEHAQVSSQPLVNQIPLNAAWNLDK